MSLSTSKLLHEQVLLFGEMWRDDAFRHVMLAGFTENAVTGRRGDLLAFDELVEERLSTIDGEDLTAALVALLPVAVSEIHETAMRRSASIMRLGAGDKTKLALVLHVYSSFLSCFEVYSSGDKIFLKFF